MANKVESRPSDDGVEIVRLISTDRDIVVPDTIDGIPVTSLCDRFLMGSPNADNRTLTIPASVRRFGKDSLSGVTGIRTIDYRGDFSVLSSAGIVAEYDVTVTSIHEGRGMSFDFISGFPISFPGFDEAILSTSFRMSPEIAMQRLSDPICLTDECREGYRGYMLRRITPMAEHAVTDNDPGSLSDLYSTGLLDTDALRSLLEISVRSGKVTMTSVIMGLIRKTVR